MTGWNAGRRAHSRSALVLFLGAALSSFLLPDASAEPASTAPASATKREAARTNDPEEAPARGAERFYYYRPDEIGARAFYKPATMILAGGFSAFGERRLHEFDFAKGIRHLGHSLKHPFRSIEAYGWRDFLHDEFLPNPRQDTGQWAPNWTWHFIGNGFRTRLLKEYFIHRGYAYPTACAWLTAYTWHYLNEVVQAERYRLGAVDALADLFFFDWAGKVVFDLDVVNEVATEVFHLTDWSYETEWDPLSNELFNVGQLYWVRLHVWGPVSISALTGELTNTINGTLALGDVEQLSIGLGIKPHDIVLDARGAGVADSLRLTFGLYYSEHDNPVFVTTFESSLRVGRENDGGTAPRPGPIARRDDVFTFNLYPGWIAVDGFEPGMSLVVRNGGVFLALSASAWPFGVGIGSEILAAPERR